MTIRSPLASVISSAPVPTRAPAANIGGTSPDRPGMMDGSVSTLAPLFATALATRNNHTTFLVGLAAALGAGISMAFAEALSDDGAITVRGNPWLRGLFEGAATFTGGIGHTLPFLLPDVRIALPVASSVVILERSAAGKRSLSAKTSTFSLGLPN